MKTHPQGCKTGGIAEGANTFFSEFASATEDIDGLKPVMKVNVNAQGDTAGT